KRMRHHSRIYGPGRWLDHLIQRNRSRVSLPLTGEMGLGFQTFEGGRRNFAVVGSGIAGMSAAWLLSQRHDVTVYEREGRIGGHSNTVMAETARGSVPVDTGFIVYNAPNYPNLTALFEHLGVATEASNMSFSVSLDNGAFEYAGGNGPG